MAGKTLRELGVQLRLMNGGEWSVKDLSTNKVLGRVVEYRPSLEFALNRREWIWSRAIDGKWRRSGCCTRREAVAALVAEDQRDPDECPMF